MKKVHRRVKKDATKEMKVPKVDEKALKEEELKKEKRKLARLEKKREQVEGYKRRNRNIEYAIIIGLVLVLSILIINKTFFKTEYLAVKDDTKITLEIPRFSYLVSDDNDKIVFKTLRKSENVKKYFEDYLQSGSFDIYTCNNVQEPLYYNREGDFFVYDLRVDKTFVIKTVSLKYSTRDYNTICEEFK